jgi:hypothetical protein
MRNSFPQAAYKMVGEAHRNNMGKPSYMIGDFTEWQADFKAPFGGGG